MIALLFNRIYDELSDLSCWLRNVRSDQEVASVNLAVQGNLPSWLKGMLLRTGPAKFEVGGQPYHHWFDGLAMLHQFRFEDSQIAYTNRFLKSGSFLEAIEAGHIVRSEFATVL